LSFSAGQSATEQAPQVRTTDDVGRWGGATADAAAEKLPAYATARRLFARLMRSLEGEIDRLEAALECDDDPERIRSLSDLIRTNQKALLNVLEFEAKHSGRTGQPNGEAIDLAAARDEVARRLARLGG